MARVGVFRELGTGKTFIREEGKGGQFEEIDPKKIRFASSSGGQRARQSLEEIKVRERAAQVATQLEAQRMVEQKAKEKIIQQAQQQAAQELAATRTETALRVRELPPDQGRPIFKPGERQVGADVEEGFIRSEFRKLQSKVSAAEEKDIERAESFKDKTTGELVTDLSPGSVLELSRRGSQLFFTGADVVLSSIGIKKRFSPEATEFGGEVLRDVLLFGGLGSVAPSTAAVQSQIIARQGGAVSRNIVKLGKEDPTVSVGLGKKTGDVQEVFILSKREAPGVRSETLTNIKIREVPGGAQLESGRVVQNIRQDSLFFSDAKVTTRKFTFSGDVDTTAGRIIIEKGGVKIGKEFKGPVTISNVKTQILETKAGERSLLDKIFFSEDLPGVGTTIRGQFGAVSRRTGKTSVAASGELGPTQVRRVGTQTIVNVPKGTVREVAVLGDPTAKFNVQDLLFLRQIKPGSPKGIRVIRTGGGDLIQTQAQLERALIGTAAERTAFKAASVTAPSLPKSVFTGTVAGVGLGTTSQLKGPSKDVLTGAAVQVEEVILKTEEAAIPTIKPTTAQKVSSKAAAKQKTAQAQKETQKELVATLGKIATAQDVTPSEKAKQAQRIKQQLKQIQKQQQRQISPQIPIQISAPAPPVKPKKPLLPPSLLSRLSTAIQTKPQLFESFGRRFGRDISLGITKTKEGSEKKLEKFLKGTLGASGFLKSGGVKIASKLLKAPGFRVSKLDPFRVVERREKRLSARSEVQEISFFKKRAPKKGKKKKKNMFGI